MNVIKDNWNQWADTWYPRFRTDEVIERIINKPESAFSNKTYAMITESFPDLSGLKICVPSSGDNHAVFAFHLLGAQVTSCDISEKQIQYSAEIAKKHGWDINFICDDTMELSKINSGEYDLVYTSNGVHVWIDNLKSMYQNVQRILKANGTYIMFDIHPFMRPFGINVKENLTIEKPYDSTGPFGDVPTYKWRIQDIMNAMIQSGLTIEHIEELFAEDGIFWVEGSESSSGDLSKQELEGYCDWRINPRAALPQWLSLRSVKREL